LPQPAEAFWQAPLPPNACPLRKGVDDSVVRGEFGAGASTPSLMRLGRRLIDVCHRALPGAREIPLRAKGRSGQTNQVWSDEEVENYPLSKCHSEPTGTRVYCRTGKARNLV